MLGRKLAILLPLRGDRPQYLPTRHGFDDWFGIPYSNNMMATLEPGERRAAFVAPKIEYWDVPLVRSERDEAGEVVTETLEQPADQTTITKRYAEEAVDPGEQWDIAAEQPEVLADVTSRALQHRAGVVLAPSEFDLRTGGD